MITDGLAPLSERPRWGSRRGEGVRL